jgi:hypothetical protein
MMAQRSAGVCSVAPRSLLGLCVCVCVCVCVYVCVRVCVCVCVCVCEDGVLLMCASV